MTLFELGKGREKEEAPDFFPQRHLVYCPGGFLPGVGGWGGVGWGCRLNGGPICAEAAPRPLQVDKDMRRRQFTDITPRDACMGLGPKSITKPHP